MKCKNCGGTYKVSELKCPYCDTENLLGRLWMQERSEAEKEYERTRRAVGKIGSVYAANRVLNRVLLVTAAAGILLLVVVYAAFGAEQIYKKMYVALNSGKIRETMAKYYEEENWEELHQYLGKYDLFGQEASYGYCQAVLLNDTYNEYLNDKYIFLELDEKEKQEDDFYLQYALRNSKECYCLDLGNYSEPDPMNEELHQEYSQEILSFWVGTLGLTEEEITQLIETEDLWTEDLDAYAVKIKERKAWQ